MLRYLLKFLYLYLYMYMLSSITFGYNLFNEIFINVKCIFFLIIKKHSKYKYNYQISIIAYITTLSYVYTTRDKVPASVKQQSKHYNK